MIASFWHIINHTPPNIQSDHVPQQIEVSFYFSYILKFALLTKYIILEHLKKGSNVNLSKLSLTITVFASLLLKQLSCPLQYLRILCLWRLTSLQMTCSIHKCKSRNLMLFGLTYPHGLHRLLSAQEKI